MCSAKTMIKIALGIGFLLVVGYFTFPQFQVVISTLAPYLLLLACPLAMYHGMRGMNKSEKHSGNRQGMFRRSHK